ncbi:MAG: protein kinase [Planctomycetes bacterium]|nr:protein kinase [Planctomycetota bacterium]MCB9904599.1 protein kinase [Planctomycetota bacterium]
MSGTPSSADDPSREMTGAEDLLGSFLEAHPEGESEAFESWIRGRADLREEAGLEQGLRSLYARWRRATDLLAEGLSSRPNGGGSFFRRAGQDRRRSPEAIDGSAGLTPGRRVGHFVLRRFLAQGGMGQVWVARDENLRADVALKLILPGRIDARSLDLFAREARAGGRLRHPYIVSTLATGRADGLTWIAQELVDGSWTLKDYLDQLRAEDTVPKDHYRSVALFVARVADGLQAAHDAGVIHRDVKPANILIAPDDTPRLTDFGLARVVDDSFLSVSGEIAGTWSYMSPEQVRAKRSGLDHRSDVFSLGVVLYELLTLRRPFEGDTAHQIAEQIVHVEAPSPTKVRSQCPRELAVICGKALEKDPARRYATMREFSADLHRHLNDEPIHARPTGALMRGAKWARRNPARAVGGAAAILLLGSTLAFALVLAGKNRTLREVNDALREQQGLTASANRRDQEGRYSAALVEAQRELESRDNNLARRVLLQCPEELRGWEWQHLRVRLDVFRASYTDEAVDRVEAAAWSPDGRYLATATMEGTVYLRSAEDGRELAVFHAPEEDVVELAWSPEEPVLVTLSSTGIARLWSVAVAGGHDVARIAQRDIGGRVIDGIGYVGDTDEGALLSWSPEGQRLDSLAEGTSRQIWEFGRSPREAALDELLSDVERAGRFDWDPARERVAMIVPLFDVVVRDAKSGETLATIEGAGDGALTDLSWSPSGVQLAVRDEHGYLHVWREDGERGFRAAWSAEETSHRMAWSPDGSRLAFYAGSEVQVLDAQEGTTLAVLGASWGGEHAFAWSPVGDMLWAGHTILHADRARATAWGEAATLREAAHAVIDPLFDEFGLLEVVREEVRRATDVSDAVRTEALRLAELHGDCGPRQLARIAYDLLPGSSSEDRDDERMTRVYDLVRRALEAEPADPELHGIHADILSFDGRLEEALHEAALAVELAPENAASEHEDRLEALRERSAGVGD